MRKREVIEYIDVWVELYADRHNPYEQFSFLSEISKGILVSTGWPDTGNYSRGSFSIPKDEYDTVISKLKAHPRLRSIETEKDGWIKYGDKIGVEGEEQFYREALMTDRFSERLELENNWARLFHPHSLFQFQGTRLVQLTAEELRNRGYDWIVSDANNAISSTTGHPQASGTNLTDEQLRALGFDLPEVRELKPG